MVTVTLSITKTISGVVIFAHIFSQKCFCGDWSTNGIMNYCCTSPEVQCMETEEGVECPQGLVLDKAFGAMCHGRCYNDYLTSQYIGLSSHYTCPDSCIEVFISTDITDFEVSGAACQGVSFCDGDEKICGEDL